MNMISNQAAPKSLAILQYNLHKSRKTTYSLLNSPDSKSLTILILQEQYWNKTAESSLQHPSWTLIQSPAVNNIPPRAIIYINNRILSANSYEAIPTSSSDIMAIKIHTQDQSLLLINIYNTLRERGDSSSAKDNGEKILIGDIFVWKKREDTLINH